MTGSVACLRAALVLGLTAAPALSGVAAAQPTVSSGAISHQPDAPVVTPPASLACPEATKAATTDAGGNFHLRFDALNGWARPVRTPPVLFGASLDPARPGWHTATTFTIDRGMAGGADRALLSAAGGARWQSDATARYVTRSGFQLSGGALVRRGYGMPLFMSRPSPDGAALPDFFPALHPTAVQWNALFTVTTPTEPLGPVNLLGSLQAFSQLNGPGTVTAAPKDRGARLGLHLKFK